MLAEVRDMMERLGMDYDRMVSEIAADVAQMPVEVVDYLGDPEGVGRLITRVAPTVPQQVAAQLGNTLGGLFQAQERVYAAVAAAHLIANEIRANSSVTLFATNTGGLCTPGTVYPLRPRIGGALAGASFEFKPTQTFFRLTSDPRDCASGFVIAGGTLGFSDERAKPFPEDVALTLFRPEIDPEDTPLASLVHHTPSSKTFFNASIYLDESNISNTKAFYGLTLVYHDTDCSARLGNTWQPIIGGRDYRALVDEVANGVRRNVSRGVMTPIAARPAPRPAPRPLPSRARSFLDNWR